MSTPSEDTRERLVVLFLHNMELNPNEMADALLREFPQLADAPPASGQPSLNERRAEFVYDAARLAARCAELERQLAENHEEAHQAYNTAVARADAAESRAEKLREAIHNALSDSALQSVAGWYDSMKGLRAALAAPAEE